MTIIISPTKQMNFNIEVAGGNSPGTVSDTDHPICEKEAGILNNILKGYSPDELASLMKMSPALAENSYRNIQYFGSSENPKKAALFSYSGTVFQAMGPESFSYDELVFAGKHLRILSGLYGVLKPMDLIEPYRLEMKIALKVPGSAPGLYHWWRDKITDLMKEETLIMNLASDEYSKVLDKKQLKGDIISFSFKEENGASLRTVGMFAKKARGVMVKRIIRERVSDPELLKQGETGGYFYRPEYSSSLNWVFVRSSA